MAFWLLVAWMGAVLVASVVISTLIVGDPFPGAWGHAPDEPRGPQHGAHRPAFAGRSP